MAVKPTPDQAATIALKALGYLADFERELHRFLDLSGASAETLGARANEPEHFHYDVRFVVRATGSEAFVLSEESHALAWRDIDAIAGDPEGDPSLRRMARRWKVRHEAARTGPDQNG